MPSDGSVSNPQKSASELEVERHIQVRNEYRLARTHVLARTEEKIRIGGSCPNYIENCNKMSAQPFGKANV
jgi:hypothetical protein